MFRMFRMFSTAVVIVVFISVVSSNPIVSQTVEPPAIEWERKFLWTSSAFQQTDDGGYVFASGGLTKTDAAGNLEWQRRYDGEGSVFYQWHSVRQTADGGYILSGWSQLSNQYNLRLIKTNAAGQLEWQKLFNGFDDASGYAVRQTNDGGFAVIGGKYPIRLLKTDAAGTLLWKKDFAGVGYAMQLTDDGGFIIVGSTLSKADASGNLEWQKDIKGFDVQPTDDGGYIVVADTNPAGGLVKTNAVGEVLWQAVLGGIGQHIGWSVQPTTDGGYLVGGVATNDCDFGAYHVSLAKTDAQGKGVWSKSLGGQIGPPQWFRTHAAIQTSDGGYAVAGTAINRSRDFVGYFVKLAPERLVAGIPVSLEMVVATIAPNRVVQLIWRDFSDNETKFIIERQVNGQEWEVLAEVAANITTYRDVNAPVGFACYRVSAASAAGRSVPTVPVTVYIPPPPAAPQALVVTPRLGQSLHLKWLDASTDETNFLVERKIATCDWQALKKLPANTTTFTDDHLPWSDRLTYRVAAVNDGGASPWVESAEASNPSVPRWQLKIYRPGPDAWFDLRPCSPFFQPNRGTAVIVHGWEPPVIGGDQLNGWMLETARLIHQRITIGVNVLAWDWLLEAGGLLPPEENINPEGGKLAAALEAVFPADYRGPTHLIGHSLGSQLIIVSALTLGQHQPWAEILPRTQLTLLDTPDFPGIGNGIIKENIRALRDKEVYIDSYFGCTNLGPHNANIWVDVPCVSFDLCLYKRCHVEVTRWYQNTIPGDHDPILKRRNSCLSETLFGTIGFGSSLLTVDADHPLPQQPLSPDCDGANGTLKFSKLSLCSNPLIGFEVFGLDNSRECRTSTPPSPVVVQEVTTGDYRVREDWQPNFGFVNSTEMFFGARASGEGGGGQLEDAAVRYTLHLVIQPEWDYLSFDYDFTAISAPTTFAAIIAVGKDIYPVFQISSDLVSAEKYLNTGLRDIRQLRGQKVSITFELRSAQPGMEVYLRNLTFWQDQWHGNHPPLANAGQDQKVTAGADGYARLTLDGSATTDQDSDMLAYQWMVAGELIAIGVQPTVELLPGEYDVFLVVRDPADTVGTDSVHITIPSAGTFLRGDSNGDATVDISDAVKTLFHLFSADNAVHCLDAADANDDGTLDISDAVYTLGYLFTDAVRTLPEPFPKSGLDPTMDRLDC